MQTVPYIKSVQIANIVAFAAVMVVNTLASTVGINGSQTGELSDRIPNLFVPAGLTFSVWGVIYLFLLLFTVFQARGLFSGGAPAVSNGRTFMAQISWLFVLSSAANIGWLLLWHWRKVALSQIAMLVLLGCLIAIYVRVGIGRTPTTILERWFVRVPFSIYLGWITVATIANATAMLVTAGWNGFGLAPEVWTVVVIVAALLITLAVLVTRRDAAYALVVVWALVGISLKRASDVTDASRTVGTASTVAAIIVAAGIVVVAIQFMVAARRGA